MARMLSFSVRGALAALAVLSLAACATAQAPPQAAAQTDHFFESRGVRIHGRLYTPAGRGPFPTVLYVTGGGNYSLITDAYALNTVRAFNERGMAVYVFDKPGLGQSGGAFENGNIQGKVEDTVAALDLLRTLRQVDQDCTIVWALSAAGWYAPQAVAGRADVCGLILVSPAGFNPTDWYSMFTRRELTRAGVTGAAQDEAVALWLTLLRYQGTAENYDATRAMLARSIGQPWYATAIAQESWEGLPETLDTLLAPDALRQAWVSAPADYEWPRERENFMDYTPAYRSVRQPVILIFGDADTLIDPAASRAIFERAWAGRDDVTITTYAGAGHGIQTRADGAENPTPAYLEQITTWARARFDQ
jgi:pimeloyl-ACP methyl ester carboxylesterase